MVDAGAATGCMTACRAAGLIANAIRRWLKKKDLHQETEKRKKKLIKTALECGHIPKEQRDALMELDSNGISSKDYAEKLQAKIGELMLASIYSRSGAPGLPAVPTKSRQPPKSTCSDSDEDGAGLGLGPDSQRHGKKKEGKVQPATSHSIKRSTPRLWERNVPSAHPALSIGGVVGVGLNLAAVLIVPLAECFNR
jgi:hypothetical protein